MISGKAISGRKPTSVSPSSCGMRDGGDWKSTMIVFREEVMRLKLENDALRSTTSDLASTWCKFSEKMELLSEENQISRQALLTTLDELRQKYFDTVNEKENLLQKLKEVEEKCALEEKEKKLFTDIAEEERVKGRVALALHEKMIAEKEMEFQIELNKRDKQIEEMQHEIMQNSEIYENTLAEKDKLLEIERIEWKKQQEAYEDEKSRVVHQSKKRGRASRPSPELESKSIETLSDKPPLAPIPFDLVVNEDVAPNISKKSRLEAARLRRRLHEQQNDDVTLVSLNKLNNLKDILRQ